MAPLSRTRIICTLAFCTASSIVFAAGALAPRPSAVAGPHATAGAQVESDVVSVEPRPTLPLPQPPEGGRGVPPGAPQLSSGSAQRELVTRSEPVDQAHAATNAQVANVREQPRPDSPNGVGGERVRAGTTDFSGHWTHVSSTYAGRGRGGRGEFGVEREVMTIWVSGAPVNCGPECTIVQNAKTLTILRTAKPEDNWAPDNGAVVLNLDGSDSVVAESNGNHYVVHANWVGDKIVVKRDFATFWGTSTVTQVLSIEDGKLKVVTDFDLGDAPTTFSYVKG